MKSKLTIDKLGNKFWKLPSGKFHRKDGPAIEYSNGNKYWYINGKLHIENGPTCKCNNGYKAWYINDVEYKVKMRSKKLLKLLK